MKIDSHKRMSRRLATIKKRCNNPNANSYSYYGGKGIKTFLTLDDIKFLWERDNADSMDRPSIDRIDSDGDYAVENCRFIEMSENIRRPNRRKWYLAIAEYKKSQNEKRDTR